MTTQDCSFSESLLVWQANPKLLEADQCQALEEHLLDEPLCSKCQNHMIRNKLFLDEYEQALIEH